MHEAQSLAIMSTSAHRGVCTPHVKHLPVCNEQDITLLHHGRAKPKGSDSSHGKRNNCQNRKTLNNEDKTLSSHTAHGSRISDGQRKGRLHQPARSEKVECVLTAPLPQRCQRAYYPLPFEPPADNLKASVTLPSDITQLFPVQNPLQSKANQFNQRTMSLKVTIEVPASPLEHINPIQLQSLNKSSDGNEMVMAASCATVAWPHVNRDQSDSQTPDHHTHLKARCASYSPLPSEMVVVALDNKHVPSGNAKTPSSILPSQSMAQAPSVLQAACVQMKSA
eukprot:3650213-Amphidinium_carterae.2